MADERHDLPPMAGAENFVHEMEEKNRASFQRLLANFAQIVEKESFSPADVLRLEMKAVVESIEVTAMWLAGADSLPVKLSLATQCGDGARHFQLLSERLAGTGVDLQTYDARFGGYSKLFAFFRSLSTTEEQAAAGAVTLRAYNVERLDLLAGHCQGKGDGDTAELLRGPLVETERGHRDEGRRVLIETATTEESQARARRSAFRTIELLGELQDPTYLRKYLNRSMRKSAASAGVGGGLG
jgi:hypothetical protein